LLNWIGSARKTKVLHRTKVINLISDVLFNARNTIEIYGNSMFLPQMFSFESIRKAELAATKEK
jgi:hypothetical protein